MKRISKSSLIKGIIAGSLLFYVLSGLTSLLNYLFYPIIARFVSTSQYGEIQFLVSMFTQLAVGFVVLNILAIIISAELQSRQERAEALKSLTITASLLILLIVTIGSIILYINHETLGLHSTTAILALGISLIINVPFTVTIGYLQGSNQFAASGVLATLGSFLKLIFSLVLVWCGLGVTGAILGIGIGMLAAFAMMAVYLFITKRSFQIIAVPSKSMLKQLLFIRKRAIVAILAITTVTLLSTADSITSRIWLNEYAAGQYAAVATLAKVILAATSPLMWLALPPAVNYDRKKLLQLIGLTAFVAASISIAFSLFPHFFLTILLGIDAGSFVDYTLPASWAMTLCSIAFVIGSIAICMGQLRHIMWATIIACIIYVGTFVALQRVTDIEPLLSSLYSQITASLCFMASGLYLFRVRHFMKR